MPKLSSIDFDSVRTHAHAITTILLITTSTGIYAFHHPHSKVIPIIILTSVLICIGLGTSTLYLEANSAVQRILCQMKRSSVLCGIVWCGWIVYGSVWERSHRLSGFQDTMVALIWLLTGMWCTLRLYQQRTVHYVGILGIQIILLYIPIESSVAQFLPAWNVLVRVTAFVLTYFSNMYVRVALEESVDSAHLVCTSLWILYVNKWMLPAVNIHWMVQLHALSTTYSRRPKRSDAHEDPIDDDVEDPTPTPTPDNVRVETPKEPDPPPAFDPTPQRRARFFFQAMPKASTAPEELLRAASKVPTIL